MFQTLIIFSGVPVRSSPPSCRNMSSTVLMGRPDLDGRGSAGTCLAWTQVLPKSSE